MACVLDTINARAAPRQPEKANRADSPVEKKPDWIRRQDAGIERLSRNPDGGARTAPTPSARRPPTPISASARREARDLHGSINLRGPSKPGAIAANGGAVGRRNLTIPRLRQPIWTV